MEKTKLSIVAAKRSVAKMYTLDNMGSCANEVDFMAS